jgi:glyoxylase-like metal-dependent hydrolase (beta-lactamase superfamily II)
LVLQAGRWKNIELAVRYGVFEHPTQGTCLIDTGYSARVTSGPRSPALAAYAALLRPALTRQTLPAHVPNVARILLTHLHADHVSALRDYPEAHIIADGRAVDHFLSAGIFGCVRCGVFRELLPPDLSARLVRLEDRPSLDAPFGLGPARDVFGDASVLAIALPGHMLGHTGYLWPDARPPLLYAGDAEWLRSAVIEQRPPGAPAAWIVHDRAAARETAQRLAAFERAGGELVFCHDPEPAP